MEVIPITLPLSPKSTDVVHNLRYDRDNQSGFCQCNVAGMVATQAVEVTDWCKITSANEMRVIRNLNPYVREERFDVQIAHAGVIRPVTSFADIRSTIRNSLAPINRAIASDLPAGVSIRLSQAALSDPATTPESLQAVLEEHGLVLHGFSSVSITGGSKEQVHQPDWRTEERLGFMFPAINLAAACTTPEREIGITTNALSYRTWLDVEMPGNWAALTLNVIRVVQHLVGIHDRTGVTVHIDLEAEPGSVLRDTADIVKFYTQWLLPRGGAMLSDRMQLSNGSAGDAILRHVRLALDTAHAAVVRDTATASLDAFGRHEIQIGRLQISSALEIDIPADDDAQRELKEHLNAFASPNLLQQVVGSEGEQIVRRFDDLPDAIDAISESVGQTWRVHTHAPLLADRYGVYASTRAETSDWLREIAARGLDVGMIELRSANWDVVPHDDRGPLETMIMQEAEWVTDQM